MLSVSGRSSSTSSTSSAHDRKTGTCGRERRCREARRDADRGLERVRERAVGDFLDRERAPMPEYSCKDIGRVGKRVYGFTGGETGIKLVSTSGIRTFGFDKW